MAHSRERHICGAKHSRGPRPFLYILGDGRIELINEVRAYNVKLVRIDADNRTYRGLSAIQKLVCVQLEGNHRFCAFPEFPRRRSPSW